jgi:hypothetical protein
MKIASRNRSAIVLSRTTPAPAPLADERRTRLRLRELCDEVLASYRVATECDLFSAEDRQRATALFANVLQPARG